MNSYYEIFKMAMNKYAAPAEPFESWFDGKEIVYIPYISDESGAEEYLREKHSDLLDIISYMGFDLSNVSLYQKLLDKNARSKKNALIGEAFFKKCIIKIIGDMSETSDIKDRQAFLSSLADGIWSSNYIYNIENIINEVQDDIGDKNSMSIKMKCLDLANIFKSYDSDDSRVSGKKSGKVVAISRREEDILNMSSEGRDWTSCMSEDGEYAGFPYHEIQNGGFIAYLINDGDLEIEKPISRVLIRRFDSESGGKSVAVAERAIYGVRDYRFLDIVNNWIDEKQGKIDIGLYSLCGMEYSDSFNLSPSILGIPSDLTIDSILKNPGIIFNISDEMFIVKDRAAYPIILQNYTEVKTALGVFSSPKIFLDKEELDSFLKIQNDNGKKSLNYIMHLLATERIYEVLEDEMIELGIPKEDSEDYLDSLLDSGSIDLEDYKEEGEDGVGYSNKLDSSKPYYSFEKEIQKMLSGESERFEVRRISGQEYLNSITDENRAIVNSIISIAVKESVDKPGAISEEGMSSLKNIAKGNSFADEIDHLNFLNPDSVDKDELLSAVRKKLSILERHTYSALMNKSAINFAFDISREKIDNLKYVLNRSSNKEVVGLIKESVDKLLNIVFGQAKEYRTFCSDYLKSLISIFDESQEYSVNKKFSKINLDVSKFIKILIEDEEFLADSASGKFSNLSYSIESGITRYLRSENIGEETFKALISKVGSVSIMYKLPIEDGGYSVVRIPILKNVPNVSRLISIDKELFIEIIKNKNYMDIMDEEIDTLLQNTSKEINTIISSAKDSVSKSDDKKTRRYYEKILHSTIKEIKKFVEDVLRIIQ